jgi:hypothetical protein
MQHKKLELRSLDPFLNVNQFVFSPVNLSYFIPVNFEREEGKFPFI